MGSNQSVDVESLKFIQECEYLDFFSVELVEKNVLRLTLAPDDIIELTERILKAYYLLDSDLVSNYKQSKYAQFQLSWENERFKNIKFNRLYCSLIRKYYELGWHLNVSTDLKYNFKHPSVLIFEKKPPIITTLMCISFQSYDIINIISEEYLFSILREVIRLNWQRGIQEETNMNEFYQIKLYGTPFTSSNDIRKVDDYGFVVPILINELLNVLFKNGWIFVSAIDSINPDFNLNALYFRKVLPNEINRTDIFNTTFFPMTLNSTNTILLHGINSDIVSILNNPQFGIKDFLRPNESKYVNQNTLKFKLKGSLWCPSEEETVTSRILIDKILYLFSLNGWELYATCHLTITGSKSALFFRSKPIEPFSVKNFSLSLNGRSLIRLIGIDEQQQREILSESIRRAITKSSFSIAEEMNLLTYQQFRLFGEPFDYDSSKSLESQVLMLFLLDFIKKNGFELYCSCDISSKYDSDNYKHGLDSFFFRKVSRIT